MASLVAKFVGKKILGETIENKFGKTDPYFETVPATRLDGKPSRSGRTKKRKKALPPGISDHDAMVLTKVKRRAYRLDMCLFNFAGMSFGWGTVLGFIPAFGDALDALLALMVMRTCAGIEGGLPNSVKIKMLFNIVFDFFIGIVPLIGDLADAAFRANTRNAVLLEEHLREKGKVHLREAGQAFPAVDPSEADEFDRMEREIASRPPSRQPSRENSRDNRHDSHHPRPPREPEPPHTRESHGWFGRKTSRPRDVEMGQLHDSRYDTRRGDRRSRR
ncbi:unnamed protein product [Clonostachys solani]|uniref:PH domain-containing protein n=1 Tax=Clonostachys solani TaxID=160281 RepID=A0A9N9YX38_9HYPO|nr:unnamed protein product [Clonostachys solani]